MTDKNTPLIVYGHDYCPQSSLMANALKEHQIEHEWRDVQQGDPAFRDELKQLARGHLSVPTVVFPDGEVMVEPWPRQVLKKLGKQKPTMLDRLLGRLHGGGQQKTS